MGSKIHAYNKRVAVHLSFPKSSEFNQIIRIHVKGNPISSFSLLNHHRIKDIASKAIKDFQAFAEKIAIATKAVEDLWASMKFEDEKADFPICYF